MTKRQVKLLAKSSFLKNKLDSKRVLRISARMKRRELREYVRAIKAIEAENRITIFVPSLSQFKKSDIAELTKLYKGKEIIYKEDPTLMVGIKILNNDLVSDFNLKNSLENIVETYD